MRTRFSALLLIVFLLTSFISPALPVKAFSALTAADPVQVGQIGGVTNVVFLDGNHLFFNVGPRMVRMDVSPASPGAPIAPGAYGGILPGVPVDIKVSNGFIYLAMGRAGVAIVNATSLLVIASQTLPGNNYANAIAVGRNYLYAAAGSSGIVSYNLGTGKNQLLLQGNLSFTNPNGNIRTITDVETTLAGSVESLFASGNNNAALPINMGGVVKFDISSSPVMTTPAKSDEGIDINYLVVSSSNVFAAGKNTLYVLNSGTLASSGSLTPVRPAINISLSPDRKSIYLVSSSGIDVIDVSAPASPVLKTATPIATQGSARYVASAIFTGNTHTFLYIADYFAGLSIASSQQTTPQSIILDSPSYVLPRPATSRAVAGIGQQVFLDNNSSDLLTINATNLANPRFIGSGIQSGSINFMTITHNMLLVAAGPQGLLRYQISADGEPSFIDSFVLPDGAAAFSMAISWPNAVIAAGHNGFYVVNIDGPVSVIGSTLPPLPDFGLSDFQRMDWLGNYAYVADYDGNFRIYDMTELTGPLPTNGFLAQSGISDVKVSGNFAFLAAGINGIQVADVTDPANPVFISGAGYATAPGLAQSLVIYHNYLFVAAGTSGVIILTIQPNGHLNFLASIPTGGDATQLAVVEGAGLYVASANGGLTVIRTPLVPFKSSSFMPIIFR